MFLFACFVVSLLDCGFADIVGVCGLVWVLCVGFVASYGVLV